MNLIFFGEFPNFSSMQNKQLENLQIRWDNLKSKFKKKLFWKRKNISNSQSSYLFVMRIIWFLFNVSDWFRGLLNADDCTCEFWMRKSDSSNTKKTTFNGVIVSNEASGLISKSKCIIEFWWRSKESLGKEKMEQKL